jgi:hypothetical protein
MTQKIKQTHVTYEQAKWLKEKKLDFHVPNIYSEEKLSTPEQHQVVEWLRVNHGIWVSVLIPTENTWYFKIESVWSRSVYYMTSGYNSPQEAYSAAFDYIKNNNLI